MKRVLSVFVIGLCLRVLYLFLGPQMKDFIWSDMGGYVSIADDLLSGTWKVTHFFQSIGYPLIIAVAKFSFSDWTNALSILQTIFSFLTLMVIYQTSRKSFDERTSFWVLLVGSVHVPWILFTKMALPETIFTFLLSIISWLTFRLVSEEKPSLFTGLGWALTFTAALWLKGTHVFLAPLLCLGLLAYRKKNALPAVLVIGVTLSLGVLSHGLLTSVKIGRMQFSASNGGLNFIEGKCPHKNNKDNAGYSWISPLYYQLHQTDQKQWNRPFTDSSYYIIQGLNCIKEDPFVLVQSLEGIPFLFVGNFTWPLNQVPNFPMVRLYELFFSLFLVCGLLLFAHRVLGTRDRGKQLIWGLPVLAIFICVYIFKSEARFRVPFDVWFIPMAIYGFRGIRISYLEEDRP